MRITGKIGNLTLGDDCRTIIMGIINLSPSSFYKGSISKNLNDIQNHLSKLIEEGADIIDVGAISSAPTFIYNKIEEKAENYEIERLSLFFKALNNIDCRIPISIDTQSSKTAKYALNNGVSVINDISGLKKDNKMADTIAEYKASVILMTCRNKPGDVYKIPEILIELRKSISLAIISGISRENIIIDPGLGKWIPERGTKDDYNIINHIEKIKSLNHCILVGISRKSFIGSVLNKPPEDRLWGSLAATSVALLRGAHVIRTHDVQETKDVCLVMDYLKFLNEKETSYK